MQHHRVPITHHLLAAFRHRGARPALRFKRHNAWLELNWIEYYRRVEVKLFECWGILKQSTGFICAAGPDFYINHKKKKPYYESNDFKVVKLREVIE